MENSAENRSDRPLAECEEKREGRRHFVKSTLAVGIGAACAAVPVYGGARMVLFPLQQTGLSGKEYPLTTLANIDETPRLYSVTDTATDAGFFSRPRSERLHPQDGGRQGSCVSGGLPPPALGSRSITERPCHGKKSPLLCPCHSDLFSLDGNVSIPKPRNRPVRWTRSKPVSTEVASL